MPINYPLSIPWIRGGADIASNYAKGFGLGQQAGDAAARINIARQQISEQSNRTALELALKQQQNERDNLIEQQKLQVAQAYHQQQSALKEQQLDQAQQLLETKVKDAAAHSLAREQFRQALQQPNADVLRSFVNSFGGLEKIPGMGQALKELEDRNAPLNSVLPIAHTLDIGGRKVNMVVNPKSGHFELEKADKVSKIDADRAMTSLDKAMMMSPETWAQRGMDTNALAQLQKTYLQRAQSAASGTTNAPSPIPNQIQVLPLPANKSELIKGSPYHTKYGAAIWDGNNFTPIQSAPSENPSDNEESDTESE